MTAPLAGIKVVEIANFVAVPAAGALLADMGAEVIKVEVPWGEIYRHNTPRMAGIENDFGSSPPYQMDNRGKRSLGLDLALPPAQDALKKLYLAEGDMDSLEQFYAKQEKWAEFIRVLEREADTAEGDVRTSLTLKIAELYKTRLEKPDRAVRALEKALTHDENNLTVAYTMNRMMGEGDFRAAMVIFAAHAARAA